MKGEFKKYNGRLIKIAMTYNWRLIKMPLTHETHFKLENMKIKYIRIIEKFFKRYFVLKELKWGIKRTRI